MARKYATDPLFKRRYKKKSPDKQAAVRACIVRVVADPFERGGLKTKPLSVADEKIFYARIDRAHRITFHFAGDTIVFRNHCHKEDVLRRP